MFHTVTCFTAVFHHARFQYRSTLTFGVMRGTDKQTDRHGNPLAYVARVKLAAISECLQRKANIC